MAKEHLSTKEAEKRVESIKEHLESLQLTSKFLIHLSNHHYECDHKAVSLSLDTLRYWAIIMDMAVDTLSAELGLLKYEGRPHAEAYIRKPPAVPEGGAS